MIPIKDKYRTRVSTQNFKLNPLDLRGRLFKFSDTRYKF